MPDLPPRQMFEKAREFAGRNDWEKAVVWYRRAADAGITDAMLVLAAHHAVRDELPTAQDWLRQYLAVGYRDRELLAGYLRGAIAAQFMSRPHDARRWEMRVRTSPGFPGAADPLHVRRTAVAVVFALLVEGIDPPGGPKAGGGSTAASGGCLLAVLAAGFLPALFAVLLVTRTAV
ncbi:hypothetical protein EH183_43380 [Streptomyces sp. CB01881]|uniref:hypothetical protein n=1 Tax=Streptomyces sp. CB01881 TaxID=2078691 RepID=UPI0011DF6443|nr:hypothetical protein [Streptomyces sp. CB01881]TYC66292.1 hypothetical protein EH183_43380 [Streptomyces sp. CB01881]